MADTIGNLLTELNINHNIDPDSPLMRLPLVLFREEDYSELITIVLLYGEKWIEPTKIQNPKVVMGELSSDHVQQFYNAINAVVLAALTNNNPGAPVFPLSVTRSNWVNPTQVTHYVRDNPTYKLLNEYLQCPEELIFFLKWSAEEHISHLEKSAFIKHLDAIQKQGNEEKSITNLVSIFFKIELFKSHTSPGLMIYELIIRIDRELENSENVNTDHQILKYYRAVLTQLSQKFPLTLDSLLTTMRIRIPDNLDDSLTLFLQQDLNTVPNLSTENLRQLIFCTTLFLSKRAVLSPNQMNFTYAEQNLTTILISLAKKCTRELKLFLSSPESCKQAVEPGFMSSIWNEIETINLSVPPCILGLLSFEACEPLRILMRNVAHQQGYPNSSTFNTVALKPSPNKFLIGLALCKDKTTPCSPMHISNHDLLLVDQLMILAKEKKEALAHTSSVDVEVAAGESLLKTNSSRAQKGTHFFNLYPLQIPETTTQPKNEYDLQFFKIVEIIKNPVLRNTLSISTIDEFHYINVLNFDAVLSFIMDYKIDSKKEANPTFEELKYFFDAIQEINSKDEIVDKLVQSKLFIDLDANIDSLQLELKQLNSSFSKLEKSLSSINEEPKDKELGLRYRWLNLQKDIVTYLKKVINQKINLTIKELESSGASNSGEDNEFIPSTNLNI